MTPKSIRSHLAPYSILSKRRTTVAHAFASALAPSDEYEKDIVEAALDSLGQKNLKQLTCVYCGRLAQTWDHLMNLVKGGKLNGYGHQIGNLVPSCRDCNSEKGGSSFEEFVQGRVSLNEREKTNLIGRLEAHLALAKPIDQSTLSPEEQNALKHFTEVQAKILALMEEADKYASVLHRRRRDG